LLGLALFVFVAGQLGGMLLVGGGTAAGIVGAILALAAAGYAVRLAAVLRPRGTLRWRVGMGLLHVWAALPLVYATYILALWTGLPEQPSVLAIRERETGWTMLAVAAALVAPVTEEVCFRGLVYPALRASLPVRQAILFTSLAFALVHPPAVWLPMAIFGMFLAWVVETTSSVAPAIAAHMAFNVYNVAMLVLV
jgi:membrane protease YdiL (CAAX protease family)